VNIYGQIRYIWNDHQFYRHFKNSYEIPFIKSVVFPNRQLHRIVILSKIKLNHFKMNSKITGRRKFLRISGIGLGGLYLNSGTTETQAASLSNRLFPTDGERLNVLCIGAHPGDPEFGCGGTMARYSDAGHSVSFLYLTRGEAWAGDPSLTYEEAAAIRTREVETSCGILNAKPVFAGQIDDHTELNKIKAEEFTLLVLSLKPDLVFTHWPLDSHLDHQVAACLSYTAWMKSGQQFDLFYYEVDTGSETVGFKPSDYVDISMVREKKKRAMFAHKSQGPEKFYDTDFRKMEDFRGLEAGTEAAEAFVHFKQKSHRAGIIGLDGQS
jgi:LmbE family N-acetylglucosaminyl deacetylase